jgi:hypothetical protein
MILCNGIAHIYANFNGVGKKNSYESCATHKPEVTIYKHGLQFTNMVYAAKLF